MHCSFFLVVPCVHVGHAQTTRAAVVGMSIEWLIFTRFESVEHGRSCARYDKVALWF